jgi:ABC-type transporter MlaC component
MKWLQEKRDGAQATVRSSVVREDADVNIEYFLQRKSQRWMVYNIIFDDLNLAKNYETQFNKIIVEKGIDELLNKMRKKLTSNDETA